MGDVGSPLMCLGSAAFKTLRFFIAPRARTYILGSYDEQKTKAADEEP